MSRTTGTAGQSSRHHSRWTSREVAFILNYTDVCLASGKVYSSTVAVEFFGFTGVRVTTVAIQQKLRALLAKYGLAYRDFMDRGTPLLNVEALPGDLLAVMQQQRKFWKLGELEASVVTEGAGAHGDTLSTEAALNPTSLKRKASIHDSRRSSMSYRQGSVSDSQTSSTEESSGSEYEEQQAKHKRRVSTPSPGRSHEHSPNTIENQSSQVPLLVLNTNKQAEDGHTLVQEPIRVSRAVPTSHTQTAPLPAPFVQSADDITALKKVQDLTQIVGVLLRAQLTLSFGMNEEIEHRLKSIQRTVDREPGQLLDDILSSLHSGDRARADMRAILHTLLDGQHPTDVKQRFPKVLGAKQIVVRWGTLCDNIKNAFGFGPFEPSPKPEDAGYVAARIDDLAKNLPIHGLDLSREFVEEIALRLESPHLGRSVLGALLCQWVFSGPEPMCIDAYSTKERKLYETLRFTSVEEVQHLDKVSMKALFDDEHFQNSQLKDRAYKLATSVEWALKKTWPGAPGFDESGSPQRWAKEALQFKQALMIDRDEYRIHYCMPGARFDPSWMQAEDNEGFPVQDAKAEGQKVATCLFPALSRLEAPRLPEDPTLDTLDSLLVVNKRFFPSFKEKQEFGPEKVEGCRVWGHGRTADSTLK
ncbi:hypothetical protein DE146DRAFT_756583 [Phaeosphaeria sp. MPI-PUGE-AT-0046c]|nr:hypothetical protein DE146DRAFT_756583 [Phaeosphaeria sp. MPI-PUGE-AT-0046c]